VSHRYHRPKLAFTTGDGDDLPMASSMIRFAKSETRDLADADRLEIQRSWGEPTDWNMKGSAFFTALVVIGAVLTVIALILR
jgi:hypothetical protein